MLCEAYWHSPHGGEEHSNKKKYDLKQGNQGRDFKETFRGRKNCCLLCGK